MPRTLLVPLDGMPLAETALPFAHVLAETLQADLDLLRVVPPGDPAGAAMQATAYLDRIANTERCKQITCWTHAMRGDARECIVQQAVAEHVVMMVMATHARAGVSRAFLGSVAQYVIAQAPAPTLLVPPGAHPTRRLHTLLVAIDMTCGAPLATVVELARAAAMRVVLVRVVSPDETAIWQWQRGPVLESPQAVVDARNQLNDLASRLRAEGVDAHARVAVGSAVPIINSMAATFDADLIVMSSHARTGAQRALQGSVTDAVVRTSMRPVLVCRVIPPPPRSAGQIDVFHALQRGASRPAQQSIPEPLEGVRGSGRISTGTSVYPGHVSPVAGSAPGHKVPARQLA